jgi:hypothetical protein
MALDEIDISLAGFRRHMFLLKLTIEYAAQIYRQEKA